MDEASLFRMIEQMRQVSETAVKTTKRVRRETERRKQSAVPGHLDTKPPKPSPPPDTPRGSEPGEVSVQPFAQIEEW